MLKWVANMVEVHVSCFLEWFLGHRTMWQALGEMDKTEVQKRFAQLMDSSSDHSFLAWVTHKIREEEEEERR